MTLFKITELLVFFIASFTNLAFGGTPCPPFADINPCYCSSSVKDETIVTCAGLRNSTELAVATHAMKSMIVDRLMLLGSFRKQDDIGHNTIEDDDNVNRGDRLPKTWLGSLRVRELEIQDVKLSNCYLCNEPLESQDDFLESLVVTHSSLEGTLCTTCNTKTKSVTTRHLQKLKNLKAIDFSNNALEVIAGNAFPNTMENLGKVVLAHNQITKVYDNAFSTLANLKHLDLSHNMLTSVNRKMFRPSDTTLNSLDVSWNSIQSLPDDMFTNMRALKEIKLSHNLIEVLSDNTMARLPIQLEKLDLKGNFLVCNCSMSWVNRRLPKNTKLTGKCVYPKEAEFQDIKPNLSVFQSCK